MSFNTTGIIKTRSKAPYAIIRIWDKDDGSRDTTIYGYGYFDRTVDPRVAQLNASTGPGVRFKKKIIERRTATIGQVTLVDGE